MPLSQNAIYLLNQRYCKNGESPENVFKRTAEFLSKGNTRLEEKFYDAMINGIFLPNSPALFNAGYKNAQLMACFILPIEDDLTAIFNSVTAMAKIFQSGGGVGINFSPLREKDAPLSKGGKSSGTLSFMGVFDNIVEVVKQGGMRRGALMGILDYTHPEIFDFIKVKLEKNLQNFNLSIMVDDSFMNKVIEGGDIDITSPLGYKINTVKAKDVFELMAFASWVNGDPALLFYDRINKDNPLYPEVKLNTTNPCSEVSLPPYGACCLGSINLSKFIWKNDFNFDKFANVVKMGMTILTNMNELSTFPLPEITECMNKYNPVGLGIMGFADCLIKLGIRYDSQECLDFIDKLGTVYRDASLAYNPDKFYFYRRIIAPTGSLSILADCSSGIEPVYDVAFERSLTIGKIEETRDLYKSEYVRTAHQVSPEWHIKVLAKWQEYIDGGASKCIEANSNIITDNGIFKIKNMMDEKNPKENTFYAPNKNYRVFSDGRTLTNVKSIYYNGIGKGYNIKFIGGSPIKVGENHKIKIWKDGNFIWKKAKELNIKDNVVFEEYDNSLLKNNKIEKLDISYNTNYNNTNNKVIFPEYMSINFSKILGMLCADGSLIEQTGAVSLTEKNDEVGKIFDELCKEVFGVIPKIIIDKRNDVKNHIITSRNLVRYIKNLIGDNAYNKHVPIQILNGSKEEKIEFINGITLGGYVAKSKERRRLYIYSGVSKYLAEDLNSLILSLGKICNFNTSYVKYKGKKIITYLVSLNNDGTFKPIENHKNIINGNDERYIPITKKIKEDILNHVFYKSHELKNSIKRGYVRSTALDRNKISYDKTIYLRKIISIEEGEFELYDMEVDDSKHSYLLNGVVSHNTVNMPYTSSVDDIKNAYITAWKSGIKGVTIYRDGSRNQVLTSTSNTNKFTQPKQFFGKCSDGECTL